MTSSKQTHSQLPHSFVLKCFEFIESIPEFNPQTSIDSAHDLEHIKRVFKTTKTLTQLEHANDWITLPAAILHDCAPLPKNHPDRKKASMLSAEKAIWFLEQIQFPKSYLTDIAHAIQAHSFSAQIETQTIEAKIVQDADRLNGVGAIGVARCFATAGLLGGKFYCEIDPFFEGTDLRVLNDQKYAVDHFYVKLFKTIQTLKTRSGQNEGQRRARYMHEFLSQLKSEIMDDLKDTKNGQFN